jgi:hypothetical protein
MKKKVRQTCILRLTIFHLLMCHVSAEGSDSPTEERLVPLRAETLKCESMKCKFSFDHFDEVLLITRPLRRCHQLRVEEVEYYLQWNIDLESMGD